MERYQSTLAIVIKKRTFHDADYMVTLLTPDLGKITCLAKGVKNLKSHRLGTLELGNVIKAHLYNKYILFLFKKILKIHNIYCRI